MYSSFTHNYSKLIEELNWNDIKAVGSNVVNKVKNNKVPTQETFNSMFNVKVFGSDFTWGDIAKIDSWLDWKSWLYMLASIGDPTGVLSWPYLNEAYINYKKDSSKINGFLLILAFLSIIPGGGKPFGILFFILKASLILKFFPFWLMYKLISASQRSLFRTRGVENLLSNATRQLNKHKFSDGTNMGEVFAKAFGTTYGKNKIFDDLIKSSKVTSKADKIKPAAKILDKGKEIVKSVVKTPSRIITGIPKATRPFKAPARIGAGIGSAAAADGLGSESKSEKEDFIDFLKGLVKNSRTPASGIRSTPVFGSVGATTPARY